MPRSRLPAPSLAAGATSLENALAQLAPRLAAELAQWFAVHARELSFRGTKDPYAIWVSEVMAQQTQVATVERYFSRFIARFPDVATLARASEDEVLSAWSGLGYYRRARLLHRGAQHVASAHEGCLPADPVALRAIPGVGPYTAGAIASIAFDLPVALVDGNVARVLSRLQGIADPAQQDAKAPAHWQAVGEILRHASPRVVAQALMELGATICTPRAPECMMCPLRSHCLAYANKTTAEIPAPKVKAASPTELWWGLVLRWRHKIWLEQRPNTGLLASMWTVPLAMRKANAKKPTAAALRAWELDAINARHLAGGSVRHVFSHRVWDIALWIVECQERPTIAREGQWHRLEDESPGGLPTLTRKIFDAVAQAD